jgi:hypothetical protein
MKTLNSTVRLSSMLNKDKKLFFSRKAAKNAKLILT